jgi:hypothetical protein
MNDIKNNKTNEEKIILKKSKASDKKNIDKLADALKKNLMRRKVKKVDNKA